MSTSSAQEKYQRWHMGECVRCGRRASKAANWEGLICRTCCEKAARTYGICPGCGTDRLLPGRHNGKPVCRDCSGITRDFRCARCGIEAHLLGGRLCERCTLQDRLDTLLEDGTGRVSPGLVPLHRMLIGMPRPKSGLAWLRSVKVQDLLTALAAGAMPLSHEAFHEHPDWRPAAHLRDLLMSCGLLPEVDKHLLHVESWLQRRLAELADQDRLPVLQRFATWHQLLKLRERAAHRPLAASTVVHTTQEFNRAHEFLLWLMQRHRPLDRLGQDDVDLWHATHKPHEHRSLRAFLTWAMRTGRMPRGLSLPRLNRVEARPLTQHRRLELLRRVLDEAAGPVRSRAAACLMLLYAQPTSRIVRLTLDDIVHEADGQVLIRLGDPPTPVPAPFSDLLLRARAERTNMNTAANADARWLFPGRRAGQPLHHRSLADLIRGLGIPGRAARTAALRQLVLQAPAPVIAQALGFHDKTTTRLASEAGGTWSRYAPNDHTQ
ncbi:hypothetical protein [Nonomuraea sp. NPDC003709]|uniref:hypothetical protein n=1 Tax=Nonomuraea sp. NPDC003709 TaxID=3154450 RepID=UPI0033B1DE1B